MPSQRSLGEERPRPGARGARGDGDGSAVSGIEPVLRAVCFDFCDRREVVVDGRIRRFELEFSLDMILNGYTVSGDRGNPETVTRPLAFLGAKSLSDLLQERLRALTVRRLVLDDLAREAGLRVF